MRAGHAGDRDVPGVSCPGPLLADDAAAGVGRGVRRATEPVEADLAAQANPSERQRNRGASVRAQRALLRASMGIRIMVSIYRQGTCRC